MDTLHNALIEAVIAEAVARGLTTLSEDELIEVAVDVAPKFGESAAEILLPIIKRDARKGLRRSRRQRDGFEKRLGKHWAEPLHLLELLVELADEFIDDVIGDQESAEHDPGDHTFDALVAIHARGCQMARAILALLRSGFADDADARWRSLHELAAISSFISKHREEDVAERFLLHEIIQQRKLALAYQKHEVRAKLDPLRQEELDELNERYASLLARFGRSFGSEYGWAASTLVGKEATLANIEADVELDHYRPYYQMASHNVHGGSHAAFFKLGIGETDRTVLLAGPSNQGLADPGHGVALSLTQMTAALADAYPAVDRLVLVMVMSLLEHETGETFLRAHEEAERITRHELQRSGRYRAMRRGRFGPNVLEGIGDKLFGPMS